MATPMRIYAEIAARYGVTRDNVEEVDHFFIDVLPTFPAHLQAAILDELLARDGEVEQQHYPAIPYPQHQPGTSKMLVARESISVERWRQPRGDSGPGADVVILTELEAERRAVCVALGLTDANRVRRGTRVYWRALLPLKRPGEFYEVVVPQSPDAANMDAARLASDVQRDWNPNAVVMVGIASSQNKDIRLGDVVVASEIQAYKSLGAGVERIDARPPIALTDPVLWDSITADQSWSSVATIRRPDGLVKRPKVHLGVIASGEMLVAGTAVDEAPGPGPGKSRHIIAIEMEGYGFAQAVSQSLDYARHMDVRAIGDEGTPLKDEGWRAYAVAVAADFARHLLANWPLEPHSHKVRSKGKDARTRFAVYGEDMFDQLFRGRMIASGHGGIDLHASDVVGRGFALQTSEQVNRSTLLANKRRRFKKALARRKLIRKTQKAARKKQQLRSAKKSK